MDLGTLQRNERRVLLLLTVVHGLLLLGSACLHAPGIDELSHLPAGYVNTYGDFDPYCVNPPLIRMIAAQPLVWFGPQNLQFFSVETQGRDRSEWRLAREFYERTPLSTYLTFFVLGRLMLLPLSILGLFTCYLWSRELFGPLGGLFTGCLWCCSPNMIAHGSLLTPDMGATVFGVLFWYALWRALQDGLPRSSLGYLGLLLGLTILSKFTWLINLPLIAAAVLLFHGGARRISNVWLKLITIVGLAFVLINACYGFQGTGRTLSQFSCVSEWMKELQSTKFAWIPLPVPADMVRGIDLQKSDFEIGMPSYFCGVWQKTGWIQYYAVGILLKTPLPALIGFFIGLVSVVCHWRRREYRWTPLTIASTICIVLPGLSFLAFVSSQTGFNHHLRYVLPVYPFMYITAGASMTGGPLAARWLLGLGRKFWQRHLFRILVAAQLVMFVTVYPHCLSYFNFLAGGQKHGHWYLINSNVDWGQDALLLIRWYEANRDKNLQGVHTVYPLQQLYPAAPPPPTAIKPGIYVYSKDKLHESNHVARYFLLQQPVGRIGFSINIYEVTDTPKIVGN